MGCDFTLIWETMSFIALYIWDSASSVTSEAGTFFSHPARLQTSSAYCPPRLLTVARVLTVSDSEVLNTLLNSSSVEVRGLKRSLGMT